MWILSSWFDPISFPVFLPFFPFLLGFIMPRHVAIVQASGTQAFGLSKGFKTTSNKKGPRISNRKGVRFTTLNQPLLNIFPAFEKRNGARTARHFVSCGWPLRIIQCGLK
jgi:hypothetical protein